MNAENKNSGRSSYQITDIKEEKTFYIIHALRNDSIFKIISKKNTAITPCENVEIGKSYALDIDIFFPTDSLLNNKIMPNLTVRALTLEDGSSVFIEEKSQYRLYKAYNLNGLCYTKP